MAAVVHAAEAASPADAVFYTPKHGDPQSTGHIKYQTFTNLNNICNF